MAKDYFKPDDACHGKTYNVVHLKLPLGWQQIDTSNVIELRFPMGTPIPDAAIDVLKASLGEFAELAVENLFKLGQLKALKDSMV